MTDILFDCEANGLLDSVTKAHCICTVNITTGERVQYGPRHIDHALTHLDAADRLIGHNILRYDLPMLWKVYRWAPKPWVVLRDTKVIARLKHPDIKDQDFREGRLPTEYRGKHSIGAWGYRLGLPKLHEDISDWSQWTADMQERCAGDVETNLRLWAHLDADNYSQIAIELEQRVDLLCERIETAGVPFDTAAAAALQADLLGRREALERDLVQQFGSWEELKNPPPKRATTKKTKTVTFNPQSRQHIEKVMRDLGWTPTEFTPSGQAKIDEPVVDMLSRQFPEAAGLAELTMINKRLGQLVEGDQALLKNVGADEKIHGAINPMGTATSRASHFRPNLAQVPSGKKPYGDRFRRCFRVPEPMVLVGADMSGLEGRGLAHYLAAIDGGAYWNYLNTGDPHWDTACALGVAQGSRDKSNPIHVIVREGAKRAYYAFIYGALENMMGSIIMDICADVRKAGDDSLWFQFFGNSKDPKSDKKLWKVGEAARRRLIASIPGLDTLLNLVGQQVEKFGAIKGLDGRIIPVRAKHSALNFLIQSAGAILCKKWGVEAELQFEQRYGWQWDMDFQFVLWVHDEYQVACRKEIADEVGKILVQEAKAAGEFYKFRIPLDSSYSVGQSWEDTH